MRESLGMYMYFHYMIIKYCCMLHAEYGHMVAILLDASLNHVKTETAGIYLNMSRVPNISWQFECERDYGHFNCDVFEDKLC